MRAFGAAFNAQDAARMAVPEWLAVVEHVEWRDAKGLREQTAVAGGGFEAERICRVHYFPAEGRSASGSTGCTTRPC